MKIISYNVNGLNAILQKDSMSRILEDHNPDVICIQETKSLPDRLSILSDRFPDYEYVGNCNQWKSGYAGVATLIKKSIPRPVSSTPHLGIEYMQGRIVTTMFDRYTLINVYTLNSGGKDDLRKEWDSVFKDYVKSIKIKSGLPIIIVGDLNVVASPLDYWGDLNSKIDSQPGMMKYEILGFHHGLLRDCDLVDTYRVLNPDGRDYSWFSYRGGARQKNHGWRLDYALCSKDFLPKITRSEVLSHVSGSDHSPILLDVN